MNSIFPRTAQSQIGICELTETETDMVSGGDKGGAKTTSSGGAKQTEYLKITLQEVFITS